MKKILMPLLVVTLICTSAVSIFSPVLAQAEATPPMSPDDTWQPPYDGGTSLEPSVGVETYGQNWPALQIPMPSPVEPGIPSSITNAYLVNSYGQLLTNLYSTQQVYLIVSFNGPGYFYLWEYYPSGSSPYGHWLCYRWYRPGAGVWRIGPFAAQQWDSSGRYLLEDVVHLRFHLVDTLAELQLYAGLLSERYTEPHANTRGSTRNQLI